MPSPATTSWQNTASAFVDAIGYNPYDVGLLGEGWRFQAGATPYAYGTGGSFDHPQTTSGSTSLICLRAPGTTAKTELPRILPTSAHLGEPAVVMGALPGTVLREVLRSVTWLRNAAAAMARLHAIALTRVPVRDERRSQQFYSAYFGFDPATAQEYEDGTVIIRNANGFDLALHPVGHVEPSPAFLHAGFNAGRPAEVHTLMKRMEADGVTIVERNDEAAYLAFKCLDPDGHRIEVLGDAALPVMRNLPPVL